MIRLTLLFRSETVIVKILLHKKFALKGCVCRCQNKYESKNKEL